MASESLEPMHAISLTDAQEECRQVQARFIAAAKDPALVHLKGFNEARADGVTALVSHLACIDPVKLPGTEELVPELARMRDEYEGATRTLVGQQEYLKRLEARYVSVRRRLDRLAPAARAFLDEKDAMTLGRLATEMRAALDADDKERREGRG